MVSPLSSSVTLERYCLPQSTKRRPPQLPLYGAQLLQPLGLRPFLLAAYGKLKKMVTLRFTKTLILHTKIEPTLWSIHHLLKKRVQSNGYILLCILVVTSRSRWATLFSQTSIIVASRYAPVTIIAAHYRSLDGLRSEVHLFTFPFSFRASPLGEEAPRKNPKAKKFIIIKNETILKEGCYAL